MLHAQWAKERLVQNKRVSCRSIQEKIRLHPAGMDLWCCGSGASRPVLQGAVRQLALSARGQGAVVEWKMRGRDDLEFFL